MPTRLTQNYWLDVFYGWIEARNMPAPQNDEALAVVDQLKSAVDVIDREHKRAEAAESRADEYAESCGGKVQPNNDETWVECVNRLAGELAIRDERENAPDIALGQERDELAAQLATAQAALEQVTQEKNRIFSIVEKVALIVRSDADDNHLTDLDSLPDNVKALSDDFFSINQELISARKELDKHEPIEWPGLTGFQP